jgi:hypothetical protein
LANIGVELGHQIPQCPVGEAEARGDRLRRLPLDDNGANRFVTALLGRMRFTEELLETRVIHDRTLEMSLNYRLERPPKDNLDFAARSRAASPHVRKQRKNAGEARDCRRCDCRQARIQQRPNPQTAAKSRDKSIEKPLKFQCLSHEIVTGFRSAEIGVHFTH